MQDFRIERGTLESYLGKDACVMVPHGVERIRMHAFTQIENYMVWVGRPGDEGVVTHEIERPMDYIRQVILPDSVTHIEEIGRASCRERV